ncbi:hypothetical protein LRS03_00370 [Rhizobacter sp. J219]|uniref:hypothetical protein n=1 Tax=Rhizobacter sp. J219 TaxID=2898430 RepID=UPI0021519610|nr:hypothetical protein [Rhizobacter sp. J219]MCR5881399.1 hypothetical protein [Rhizobacter sp. J219]
MAILEDENFDTSLLLLSSDWFLPYWQLASLEVPLKQRADVQAVARREVQALLGASKNFWDANFDPQRFEVARAALLRAIAQGARSDPVDSTGRDGQSLALIGAVLEASVLGEELDAEVSGEVAAVVRECIHKHSAFSSSIDFELAAKHSSSDWDGYLRSLTPDLPTYLSDFASEHIEMEGFSSLWAQLVTQLSPRDLGMLASWLGRQASVLVPEATLEIQGWLEQWIQHD